MQIKKPLHSLHKRFADLNRGECFYSEGEYYMKIQHKEAFQVVNLETGRTYTVTPDMQVIPLPKAFIDLNWR